MINLGDEVKDKVSGFRGIAVARHEYLQGCNRISVQPPINENGELPEVKSFDEPQLAVITTGKVNRDAPADNTGGPEKYKDPGRPTG